jgi:hypothetical protein
MENTSNIRKEVSTGPLNVHRVHKTEFQKDGTLTAELKQVVETVSFYPTKSVSNSLSDNIFSMEDFGFEEKQFPNKETRVAWIDVPTGMTVKSVQEQLTKTPDACLYRILSNRPIIADTEQHAIDNPEFPNVTLDSIANKQVVRIPKGEENEGKLALINGKPQYRRIAFSKVSKEDVDMRTSDTADFYQTPEIKAELNGTVVVEEAQKL